MAFEHLQKQESTVSLGNLCQCSNAHTVPKCLQMFRGNLFCSSLCWLPLALELGKTEKRLVPSSLYSSYSYYRHWCYTPKSPHLQAQQSHFSQPLLTGEVLQSPSHISGTTLDFIVPCLCVLGMLNWAQDSWYCLTITDYRRRTERITSLDLVILCLIPAKNTFSLLIRKDILLTLVQFVVHWNT